MPQEWWKPTWSVPAAMRAVRAAIVVPSLFAIAYKVIGSPQTALYATFGGIATLVIAGFGGTRTNKLSAHTQFAVVGSLALIIGTLVSGTTWLAALVTVPVTFAIFFGGIVGPNAATGAIAAMFAYVLPVVSAGGAATIPSRLEGWWMASVAGTIAVLLLSPPAPGHRLRAATAELAGELAGRLRAAADGQTTTPAAMRAAKERLRAAFDAAPYRPTMLGTADQALGSLVQLLEWGASQVGDAFDGHIDLARSCPQDRALLRAAAGLFADTQALLAGQAANPDFAALERARRLSAERLRDLSGRAGEPDARVAAAQAVHAQSIAVVARGAAADALIVSHRASAKAVEAERRDWYGFSTDAATAAAAPAAIVPANATPAAAALAAATNSPRIATNSPRMQGLIGAVTLVRRHASVRSVWFLNSLRAAVALAAAVAVADASGVQDAFWVVLGTLSVLRTSAAATGSTALRALGGTVVGFVVGAALLIGIGTHPGALWAVFPVAVLVAAYAPGTTSFLVGQAAFTVTVVVVFNLLAPVGWTIGLLRIEDVAIGCGVSLAVGVLLWPRGVSSVVGDDLADAFRSGAAFLTQAVDWALSELMVPPAASIAAVSAGIRLDDAMRCFLTEQGSKKLGKEDLWTLVNAATRLRLTAHTLAALRPATPVASADPGSACLPLAGSDGYAGAPACTGLRIEAADLAGFYGTIAQEVSRPSLGPTTVSPPLLMAPVMPRQASTADANAPVEASPEPELPHPHLFWVQEHLHHLSKGAQSVSEPAQHMAEVRRRPWWR
ncbi:FUSC family protein [Streptomyces sp. CoT10]|uniref:FUSC family protein n=1 Tax=Streptomyces sp. CoT10 TaxID=2875762 RepID=UPI001CD559E1|nr:FUSC family protein [Streptomyces sp. CoT10]